MKTPSKIFEELKIPFAQMNPQKFEVEREWLDRYHKQIMKKLKQMEKKIDQAIKDANTHGF